MDTKPRKLIAFIDVKFDEAASQTSAFKLHAKYLLNSSEESDVVVCVDDDFTVDHNAMTECLEKVTTDDRTAKPRCKTEYLAHDVQA